MEITVSATGRGHAEKSVITANIVDLVHAWSHAGKGAENLFGLERMETLVAGTLGMAQQRGG